MEPGAAPFAEARDELRGKDLIAAEMVPQRPRSDEEDFHNPQASSSQVMYPEQISYRIKSAVTFKRLQQLFLHYGERFNAINMSALISKLPKVVEARGEGLEPQQQALVENACAQMSKMNPQLFDARQCANIIWGLGKLQYIPDRNLIDSIVHQLLQVDCKKLKRSRPQELSNIAYGLALCRHTTRSTIWREMSKLTQAQATAFQPQELTNLLWAYATMGKKDMPLCSAVTDAALPRLAEFKPQELANLAWAYGKLGYKDVVMLDAVVDALLRSLSSCIPQDFANTMWALAALRHRNIRLFQVNRTVLSGLLGGAQPEEISQMVNAYAKLRVGDEWFLSECLKVATHRLTKFHDSAVASLGHAYARLQSRGLVQGQYAEMEGALEEYALKNSSSMGATEVCILLHALVLLGRCDRKVVSCMLSSLSRRLNELRPQGLVVVAWVCAKLGYLDTTLMTNVIRATYMRLDAFKAAELAVMAHSFAKLRLFDNVLFDSIARTLLPRIGSLTPQGMSMTMWALAQARHYDGPLTTGIAWLVGARLSMFKSIELSNLVWAVAVLKFTRPAFYKTVAEWVAGSHQQHSSKALTKFAWSFARVGHRHSRLYHYLSSAAIPQLQSFTPHEVTEFVWSFCVQEYYNPGLYDAVGQTWLTRVDQLVPDDLATIAWAYARVKHTTSMAFLSAIADHFLAMSEAASAQCVMQWSKTAWSLCELEHPKGPSLRSRLISLGQEHLLDHWGTASAGQRDRLPPQDKRSTYPGGSGIMEKGQVVAPGVRRRM